MFLNSIGVLKHAEARVDADVEVGRADVGLDGAELQAVDHARDRAKLAARIDADLDAAVGRLLERLLVELDVLVLGVVEGGGAELHREVGGRSRRELCEADGQGERDESRNAADAMIHADHDSLPWDMCVLFVGVLGAARCGKPNKGRMPCQ